MASSLPSPATESTVDERHQTIKTLFSPDPRLTHTLPIGPHALSLTHAASFADIALINGSTFPTFSALVSETLTSPARLLYVVPPSFTQPHGFAALRVEGGYVRLWHVPSSALLSLSSQPAALLKKLHALAERAGSKLLAKLTSLALLSPSPETLERARAVRDGMVRRGELGARGWEPEKEATLLLSLLDHNHPGSEEKQRSPERHTAGAEKDASEEADRTHALTSFLHTPRPAHLLHIRLRAATSKLEALEHALSTTLVNLRLLCPAAGIPAILSSAEGQWSAWFAADDASALERAAGRLKGCTGDDSLASVDVAWDVLSREDAGRVDVGSVCDVVTLRALSTRPLDISSTNDPLAKTPLAGSTTPQHSTETGSPMAKARDSRRHRPASEILSQITWDPSLNEHEYIVGYEDRHAGMLEIEAVRWVKDSEEEEFVPLHRVRYFRTTGGRVVWDRAGRVDLL